MIKLTLYAFETRWTRTIVILIIICVITSAIVFTWTKHFTQSTREAAIHTDIRRILASRWIKKRQWWLSYKQKKMTSVIIIYLIFINLKKSLNRIFQITVCIVSFFSIRCAKAVSNSIDTNVFRTTFSKLSNHGLSDSRNKKIHIIRFLANAIITLNTWHFKLKENEKNIPQIDRYE